MLTFSYILFVCYTPILFTLLPKIGGDISVVWLLFFMLPFGILISAAIKKRLRIFNAWIFMLTFFSFIVCMSIIWSDHRSYDLFTLKRLFGHIIVPLFVSICAYNLFDEKKNIRLFAKNVSYAALILSIIAVCQFISQSGSHTQAAIEEYARTHNPYEIERYIGEVSRVSSTFENANALALFLCVSLPIIFYCWDRRLLSQKMIIIIVMAVIAGVMATGSRKGLISLGFTAFLYYFTTKKIKQMLIVGVMAVAVIGMMASQSYLLSRFDERRLQKEFSARWGAASIGLKMFADSPLIGSGYEGYTDNVMKYLGYRGRARDAHNLYVTLLANYGLLGFLPYMAVLIYPLIASIRKVKISDGTIEANNASEMAAICIAALIPFMISAWFSGGIIDSWQLLNLLYTIIMFVIAQRIIENDVNIRQCQANDNASNRNQLGV